MRKSTDRLLKTTHNSHLHKSLWIIGQQTLWEWQNVSFLCLQNSLLMFLPLWLYFQHVNCHIFVTTDIDWKIHCSCLRREIGYRWIEDFFKKQHWLNLENAIKALSSSLMASGYKATQRPNLFLQAALCTNSATWQRGQAFRWTEWNGLMVEKQKGANSNIGVENQHHKFKCCAFVPNTDKWKPVFTQQNLSRHKSCPRGVTQ